MSDELTVTVNIYAYKPHTAAAAKAKAKAKGQGAHLTSSISSRHYQHCLDELKSTYSDLDYRVCSKISPSPKISLEVVCIKYILEQGYIPCFGILI